MKCDCMCTNDYVTDANKKFYDEHRPNILVIVRKMPESVEGMSINNTY